MDLNQIRQQYPQYAGVSDEILAEGLRKKFYPDMDPQDFGQRIGLLQHPIKTTETDPSKMEYPDTVARGRQEAALNVVSGMGATIAGGLSAIAHGGDADEVKRIQEKYTYQPKTIPGKKDVEDISLPFTALAKGADIAGGKVTDITGSPAAGAAVNTAIQMAPSLIGAREGGAVKDVKPVTENIIEEATHRSAQEKGFKLTPTYAGGKVSSAVEAVAGSAPLQRSLSRSNEVITQNLSKGEIGLKPNEPLTKANINKVKAPANSVYDKLSKLGDIPTDKQYAMDIKSLDESDTPSFKGAQNPAIDKLKQVYGTKKFTGEEAVKQIRILRKRSNKNIKNATDANVEELGWAQKKVADALENQLERFVGSPADKVGNPQLLEDFKAARKQLAKVHSVEDALNPSTGKVSARELGRQLDKGVPLSGDLKVIADTHNAFPKVMQDTQRMPGGKYAGYFDAGAGAITALSGHPAAAVGIGVARPLMRGALETDAMQKVLKPKTHTVKETVPKKVKKPSVASATLESLQAESQ